MEVITPNFSKPRRMIAMITACQSVLTPIRSKESFTLPPPRKKIKTTSASDYAENLNV